MKEYIITEECRNQLIQALHEANVFVDVMREIDALRALAEHKKAACQAIKEEALV